MYKNSLKIVKRKPLNRKFLNSDREGRVGYGKTIRVE